MNELWIELIQQVGFPIAVCVALGWFVWTLYKASERREEKLMAVNSEAISTIAKYADRLTIIEEDIKVIKDDVTQIIARETT